MKALLTLILVTAPLHAQDIDAKTPLSVDLNLDSRATYEAIAERASLNVIFTRNFKPKAAESFKVESETPAEALDLLARQSGSFWTAWDKQTIIVAEDTQQNRQDYDRQFVKVLPVSGRPAPDIFNELRANGYRSLMATGTAILVRDSAPQVQLAARAVNPNAAALTFDLDEVFVADNTQSAKTPESRRSELKVKNPGRVTLKYTNESTRAIYETLAKGAGVNVLFHRQFRPVNVSIALKSVGFFDALDLVALATSTFWVPVNETTFLVLEDTQQNRRDHDSHTVETIYLPEGTTVNQLNEILSSLRTVLGLRGIFQSEASRAIVIHDTPARIVLAESVIADLTGAPIRKKVATNIRTVYGENKDPIHTAGSDRALLQIKTRDLITFTNTGTSKEAFEKLGQTAGLQVLFGRTFRPQLVNFSTQGVDVIEAMDLLALQSGTFWEILDPRTILVLDDNQQNRRDFEEHLVKIIYLPKDIAINNMNGILNVLRTAFAMRGLFQYEEARAIVIHATPSSVARAETIIEHLNPLPTPARSVTIPAPHYAENAIGGIASAVRGDLDLKVTTPISINLNQDSRATFQALGDMAGLQVNFSADYRPNNLTFRLEDADILDALDYAALLSGSAWKVMDKQTIFVFPDNQQNRRTLETPVTRTFPVTNTTSSNAVAALANVLRTVFGMRNVSVVTGAITVEDTAPRVLLAEKVIASLQTEP